MLDYCLSIIFIYYPYFKILITMKFGLVNNFFYLIGYMKELLALFLKTLVLSIFLRYTY